VRRQKIAVDAETNAVTRPGIHGAVDKNVQGLGHRDQIIYAMASAA
jgi:hypothetical protein